MKELDLIGVDIGGSHITVGKITFGNSRIPDLEIERSHVNSLGTSDEILEAWLSCIQKFPLTPQTRIGIAMPAPFDYLQGISWIKDQGKFLSLYGKNIKKELAHKLMLLESQVAFINDAAAFLQGEAYAGGWNKEVHLMGLTLGTGLGSAFKRGELATDGALWASPFNEGIAEDYLSTAYFTKWAAEEWGKEVSGLKDLLEEAETRSATLKALEVFGQNLGAFMSMHIQNTEINRIIIGGNMVKAEHLFLPRTKAYLAQKNLFPELIISKLGEKAALIGAASVFKTS